MVLAAAGPAGGDPPSGLADGAPAPATAVAPRPPGLPEVAPAVPQTLPEELAAASAILVDGATGEILYARAARERRAPASLTKVMTAVVVLERARLTDQVLVSRWAPQAGGFSIGLRAGQRLSVQDLLAALLIRSANDAAVALAEHVGGSVPDFANLMNAKAQVLGMRDTHFRNPHGLDAPDHYASAYDLAILTRYALQNPIFARLVQTRQTTITVVKGAEKRRGRPVVAHRLVRSHNRLLAAFEGADGVKTGFTNEAGRCLVASAQRGERRLIAVLLKDARRWDDAATLLEYGFSRVGAPAGVRAPSPGGLAPPPRTAPDDSQVGG
jgi:serine-type D-Ala-D-Ala carboxypeptidase (penicillin-binding protein 5/6)